MTIWLPLVTLVCTLIVGVPIYICMMVAGGVYFFINPSVGTFVITQLINAGVMKFS